MPEEIVSANGEMQIRFVSGATESARGFSAVFSADCPELKTGEGMYNFNTGSSDAVNHVKFLCICRALCHLG